MNALIRKEVRLLLPNFVISLLLGFSTWLLFDNASSSSVSGLRSSLFILPFGISPALLVMLTLDSFGREINAETFSGLLAQPVSRRRIWRTKTLLLAGAVAIIWAAWWLSLISNRKFTMTPRELQEAFLTTILFALAAYSGGLWTVLFFRQVASAFWFTVLTPSALAMFVAYLFNDHSDDPQPALVRALVIVLTLYSGAGFFLARWLFLRAQDVHWTGGTIALPAWWRAKAVPAALEIRGRRRPRGALFRKEFQLHQSQLILAGLLALLHLGVLGVRKFADLKSSGFLQLVSEGFWVLWLVMPLLIGCAAVAEERKLGTLEAQLCLPARRRSQFLIKFVSTLLLSVLLGAALPVLFEGARILPDIQTRLVDFALATEEGTIIPLGHYLSVLLGVVLPFLVFASVSVGVAAVSFYASTLARNTMQAFAPAVLGILLACFLWSGAGHVEEYLHSPLWRGPLVYVIGVPVMLVTLAALMFGNFKHVLVGWKVWRRNLLVLLAALASVTVATGAIFRRPWEWFGALEPMHGAARLNTSGPVQLQGESAMALAVQFSDGRNWATHLTLSVSTNLLATLMGDWPVGEATTGRGFLEGTNWASVARGYPGLLGVKTDGTLWFSEPAKMLRRDWASGRPQPLSPLSQLGTDRDWKSVVYRHAPALLLKNDGTLWRLGTNRMNALKEWPGFGAFTPERLGPDTDWAELSSSHQGRVIFRKADGRTGTMPALLASDGDTHLYRSLKRPTERTELDLDAETRIYRATQWDRMKSILHTWSFSRRNQAMQAGLFSDGTFGVCTVLGERGFEKREIHFGTETNWLATAGEGQNAVTLKADGTLWKWNFGAEPVTKPETVSAQRFGRHSDWVGLTDAAGGVVALAADGGLWFWRFDSPHLFPADKVYGPYVMASRRPQLIGNIFAPTP